MNKCEKNLFFASGVTVTLSLFVKFFALVALLIVTFYARNYGLASFYIIIFLIMTAFEILVAHYFKTMTSEDFRFGIVLAFSIYLTLFNLVLPGVLGLIATLRLNKNNL